MQNSFPGLLVGPTRWWARLFSRAAAGLKSPAYRRDEEQSCVYCSNRFEALLYPVDRLRRKGASPTMGLTESAVSRRWGESRLKSRKGTGRPCTLTPKQKQQVRRWICGKDPRQYAFDFGLWTRQIVGELIAQKFKKHLSLSTVGRWGASAKRSLLPSNVAEEA